MGLTKIDDCILFNVWSSLLIVLMSCGRTTLSRNFCKRKNLILRDGERGEVLTVGEEEGTRLQTTLHPVGRQV